MSKSKFKATTIIRSVLKQYDVRSDNIWTNKYSDSKRTVKFYAKVNHDDNVKIINAVKRELKKHGETLVDLRFHENLYRGVDFYGIGYTSKRSPSAIIFEVNV